MDDDLTNGFLVLWLLPSCFMGPLKQDGVLDGNVELKHLGYHRRMGMQESLVLGTTTPTKASLAFRAEPVRRHNQLVHEEHLVAKRVGDKGLALNCRVVSTIYQI